MDRNARTKYQQIKGKLIARGYTIRSWAHRHGYAPTTVYSAASGERSGIIAVRIRRQLEAFLHE